MRQILLPIGLTLGLALPVAAQEFPRAEVFGGYSFLRAEGVNGPGGFQVNVAGNVNRFFGIVTDVGASFKKDKRLYTFGGGLRFSKRGEAATGFVHAMVGLGTYSKGNESWDGFGVAFGGGLDVNAGERVAVRTVLDWIGGWQTGGLWTGNAFRVSAGIVFKIGDRS